MTLTKYQITKINEYKAQGIPYRKIAQKVGASPTSVVKYIKSPQSILSSIPKKEIKKNSVQSDNSPQEQNQNSSHAPQDIKEFSQKNEQIEQRNQEHQAQRPFERLEHRIDYLIQKQQTDEGNKESPPITQIEAEKPEKMHKQQIKSDVQPAPSSDFLHLPKTNADQTIESTQQTDDKITDNDTDNNDDWILYLIIAGFKSIPEWKKLFNNIDIYRKTGVYPYSAYTASEKKRNDEKEPILAILPRSPTELLQLNKKKITSK